MYKWNQKIKNDWIESKICIVKVLCICAKVTEICQYNEYHLSVSVFTESADSSSGSTYLELEDEVANGFEAVGFFCGSVEAVLATGTGAG
jgi:hypothetical protein